MTLDFTRWAPSLTAFAEWLLKQNPVAAKLWSRRLNSADAASVESAVAEAVTWDYISSRCDAVRLVEVPGRGGVDFEFTTQGNQFLVEVTNISIGAATNGSGLSDQELRRGFYGLLTDKIRQKVRSKLGQAQSAGAQPILVAVTTLHWNASIHCVDRLAIEFAMGSPPAITSKWNPVTGDCDGDLYQSTDMTRSVFLVPQLDADEEGNAVARAKYEPISGFILGGFGLRPDQVRVFGALNPEAIHPFDPSLLPDVPFCSFREWPAKNSIGFSWTITEDEERRRSCEAAERRLRAAGHGALVDETRRERLAEQQSLSG